MATKDTIISAITTGVRVDNVTLTCKNVEVNFLRNWLTYRELSQGEYAVILNNIEALKSYLQTNHLKKWSEATVEHGSSLSNYLKEIYYYLGFKLSKFTLTECVYTTLDTTEQCFENNGFPILSFLEQDTPQSWVALAFDVPEEPTPDPLTEVSMTSPDGVTLAAKGKYCDKNVKVTPVLEMKTITGNGTYMPSENKVGFSEVVVEVPSSSTENLDAELTLQETALASLKAKAEVLPDKDGVISELLNKTITTVSSNVVTSIPQYAFENCTLLTEVSFPNATTIGGYAFAGCEAIEELSFPEVITIGYNALNPLKNLKRLNLPKFTAFIGGGAGTQGLVTPNLEELYVQSLETINLEFLSSSKIKKLHFPSVTSASVYWNGAILRCSALERVEFDVLTSVKSVLFSGCTNLKTFILRTTSAICTIQSNTFNNTKIATSTEEGFIYVQDDKVDEYKVATNWATYASKIKGLSELPAEE